MLGIDLRLLTAIQGWRVIGGMFLVLYAFDLLPGQQPIEQLDRVVLVEKAVVDQALVFVTGPAMLAGLLRLLHARTPACTVDGRIPASQLAIASILSAAHGRVNVEGSKQPLYDGAVGQPELANPPSGMSSGLRSPATMAFTRAWACGRTE